MQKHYALMLGVWREACRHIEIDESVATIAPMLARYLPLAAVVVRRLDAAQGTLETAAVGYPGGVEAESWSAGDGHSPSLTGRTVCDPEQLRKLLAWCGRGHPLRRGGRKRPGGPLDALLPVGIDSDALAGPLAGPEGPAGVLALIASEGRRFTDEHTEVLAALLEPFAAALENDRRLREMHALREAAEADRRTLLTRLGRRDLGDAIVGAESGLRGVMDRVELVARSDATALILGETGTGKELVARAIHHRSARAAGPFIRVNCGAIPPELIDSQLFGHERGSFTGATDTRQGWFERADGGTLFLDEIGELPLAAQVRLLRVLQDGFIERVGGQHPIRVDVRIVAATHRDLAAMVKDARFREDLWYRVAVFPILLPPLRERAEDLPGLACHFAERAATRFGLPLVMPTPDDLRNLRGYPWPGNVRELAAVIDRAAILGNGQRLEVGKALGFSPHATADSPPTPAPAVELPAGIESSPLPTAPPLRDDPRPAAGPPPAALDDAVRRHIEAALEATYGRVEGPFGAARALRVNPQTLRSRMRKMGIAPRAFRPRRGTPDLPPSGAQVVL